MKIQTKRPIGGRDFYATMECEHCGHTQQNKSGYDDAYYHDHVIPGQFCGRCGQNRDGFTKAEIDKTAMLASILVVLDRLRSQENTINPSLMVIRECVRELKRWEPITVAVPTT